VSDVSVHETALQLVAHMIDVKYSQLDYYQRCADSRWGDAWDASMRGDEGAQKRLAAASRGFAEQADRTKRQLAAALYLFGLVERDMDA
jgi:hypothetical protein